MSNEPNKPIPAQELTDKELEGVVGGGIHFNVDKDVVTFDLLECGVKLCGAGTQPQIKTARDK